MKRILPIGFIVVGALLVFVAYRELSPGSQNGLSTDVSLPAEVAGLPRTEVRTGAEAMAEFESLHGKQFPLTSGSIAMYGGQRIILWIAGTSTDATAGQLVNSMRDRIAEGNSPFTPLTEITDRGRTVYVLEGMGQQHYYFQSKNLVIWLAADPSLSENAIQQTLEAYP